MRVDLYVLSRTRGHTSAAGLTYWADAFTAPNRRAATVARVVAVAPGTPDPAEFEYYYNGHRPHRSLAQAAPLRPFLHRPTTEILKIQRRDRLGGLLHEYQQVA